MFKVLNDVPCRLSLKYCKQLRALIFKMLQKNPDERPTTHQILDMDFLYPVVLKSNDLSFKFYTNTISMMNTLISEYVQADKSPEKPE